MFAFLIHSQIMLVGSEFIYNSLRVVLAGGIGTAISFQCNVTIIESSAFNNTALQLGGAMYVILECFLCLKMSL